MNQGLKRNATNKVIAGVCSGLADHFNMDTAVVRLIFVLLAVFALGGVIAYIILWIVLPEAYYDPAMSFNEDQNAAADVEYKPADTGKGQLVVGITLISIGALFLVAAFIPRFNLLDFWPVVLIALGVLILQQATKKM
ncbi:MAG: PspC domain-containing protein [Bacteroidetes bacterium]|nr:PspC domain-containing protein [Bacteroidota bacterium]MBU1578478.1 PspC domain-containing protein [Bacteroidota bacterium]MBU2466242.1 PspC domain-containing protein [Bacteroidota bacterium]MBU2558482.1 PspC domain-containing protein [Bacteroidota bacterium]